MPTAEEIQLPRSPTKTPLFLLHDGGGTIFSYHLLSPLNRPIYGIANPRFDPEDQDEPGYYAGGVPYMARLYTDIIEKTISSPSFPKSDSREVDIILGGWSFGGILSLEITAEIRRRAQNPFQTTRKINVKGMIFIDTAYPILSHQKYTISIPSTPQNLPRTHQLASQCMQSAVRMLQVWEPPSLPEIFGPEPIKIVLVRGTESVPKSATLQSPSPSEAEPKSGSENDPPKPVDVYRKEPDLGWSRYKQPFFDRVLYVQGAHHYDIFSWGRVDAVSRAVGEALDFIG